MWRPNTISKHIRELEVEIANSDEHFPLVCSFAFIDTFFYCKCCGEKYRGQVTVFTHTYSTHFRWGSSFGYVQTVMLCATCEHKLSDKLCKSNKNKVETQVKDFKDFMHKTTERLKAAKSIENISDL